MELLDMVRSYQTLLDKKSFLQDQTKENNAAIDALKEQDRKSVV